MGIFGKDSPFDTIVEKVTLETNTKEDWAQILDICDKVASSPQAPKECLRAIIRRLNHQDPHVVIQAATLLDACISNCGQAFHLEIASRDFEQEYKKILNKAVEKALRDKLLGLLEKWATTEFKNSPQLDLIPSFYNKLKASGVIFPSSENSPSKMKKSSGSHNHHQNHKSRSHGGTSSASAAQQEEEDLAKAIELSLKETQNSQKSKSLYPQGLGQMGTSGGSSSASTKPEPRKVRALYDFEAAEDNELTFYAGEIVHVLDDSDVNWWQGSNQRGSGLFPSNFVTADLSAEPAKSEVNSRKSVQFNDDVEVQTVEHEPEIVEIDETKIDRVLHLLNEADTNGEIPDPPELGALEDHVNQMGPLIDAELEKIDRRHAQLTRLGSELVDALNMYHHLMGPQRPPPMSYDPRLGPMHGQGQLPASAPGGQSYGPPAQHYAQMPNNMPVPPWTAPPSTGPYYVQSQMPHQQYAVHQPLPPGMMLPHGMPTQNGLPPQQVASPTHLPQVNSAPLMSSGHPSINQPLPGQGHIMSPVSPPQQHQFQQQQQPLQQQQQQEFVAYPNYSQ